MACGAKSTDHQFLSASSGGPIYYVGRDMKLSHEGMGIDESDWRIFVGCLNATLDKFNVPEPERAGRGFHRQHEAEHRRIGPPRSRNDAAPGQGSIHPAMKIALMN